MIFPKLSNSQKLKIVKQYTYEDSNDEDSDKNNEDENFNDEGEGVKKPKKSSH
jgi:hypothetical protein